MFGASKDSTAHCIKHINDRSMFTQDTACLYASPFARVWCIFLDTLFADADHDFTAQVQMPDDPNLKFDRAKYSTESMTTRRANKAKFEEDLRQKEEEEIRRKEEVKIMLRYNVEGAVQDYEDKVLSKECLNIWLELIAKVEKNIKDEEEKKRREEELAERIRKEKELEEYNKHHINPANSKFKLNDVKEKPKDKNKIAKKQDDDFFGGFTNNPTTKKKTKKKKGDDDMFGIF